MAFPICRCLKVLKPTRNAPIFAFILLLIFGTFFMSMIEIASLERRIRDRMSYLEWKNGPTEPVEGYGYPQPSHDQHSDVKVNFPKPKFRTKGNDVDHAGNNNGTVKMITWLSPPLYISEGHMFSHCVKKNCRISFNASDIPKSDAVIFEGRHSLLASVTPPPRMPGQIYVFFMMEPPSYVNVSKAWSNVFNWTVSYRRDSDVWKPYGELRRNRTRLSEQYFKNVLKKKNKAVAWIVSRCQSQGLRERYVKELSKYIQVDIFGRCGTTQCGKDCYKQLDKYYFYLSFENSFCRDYVTEKFFKTFKYDVVPVVRGGADYASMFPKDVFINTADFKTIEALGKHLSALMQKKDQYINILKEKHKHYTAFPVPWCEICHQLQNVDDFKKTVNIHEWLARGQCVLPKDV